MCVVVWCSVVSDIVVCNVSSAVTVEWSDVEVDVTSVVNVEDSVVGCVVGSIDVTSDCSVSDCVCSVGTVCVACEAVVSFDLAGWTERTGVCFSGTEAGCT